jgi:putative endonuclease
MGALAYMLRCGDGSYYVSCATGDDLSKRIAQHERGEFHGYTSTRRPVHFVWSKHFECVTDAVAAEWKIKGWSRAKKEADIREDWESITLLARRRAGRAKSKP